MTTEHDAIQREIDKIGAERLRHFVYEKASAVGEPLCLGMLKSDLDSGRALAAALEKFGFSVTQKGPDRFSVSLELIVDPESAGLGEVGVVGDGGSWDIQFDDQDNVVESSGGSSFMI